jgi:hypothetical protein
MAALRNAQFLSLPELNAAIREKLEDFNTRPFQKIEGCRRDKFMDEKPFLLPLPRHPYEVAEWKVATVQRNYHIECVGQYYSVPYKYIGKKVDIRITRGAIEIFYEGLRICSHARPDGFQGKYNTDETHMPPAHQRYLEWSGDRFRGWAAKIGSSTESVVDYLLSSVAVEQQAYKTCNALLHLADKYSADRLEAACAKAISFTPRPSFKTVHSVLKSGAGMAKAGDRQKLSDNALNHGFIRGSKYYGGDGDAE